MPTTYDQDEYDKHDRLAKQVDDEYIFGKIMGIALGIPVIVLIIWLIVS